MTDKFVNGIIHAHAHIGKYADKRKSCSIDSRRGFPLTFGGQRDAIKCFFVVHAPFLFSYAPRYHKIDCCHYRAE